MKARSVVFDLFGDYVRYFGGEIRLRSLIELAGIFGVSGPTIRVVTARMRNEGWFDTRREGRETVYVTTHKLLHLLDEGRERIFTRMRSPWDGHWSMVIYSVPETDRPTREQLRRTLSWLGFGPLATSTWICPHDRLSLVAEECADVQTAQLDLLTMSASGLPADRDLASRCWDLETLNGDYRQFLREHRPRLADFRREAVQGEAALLERLRLIHEYRKFPFRDPDLPIELLPAGWVGHEAHDVFLESHRLLQEPAEHCYRDAVVVA
ncbi:MAG: PaaX family transcriptional regulator [Nocardioidaceae bacterium]